MTRAHRPDVETSAVVQASAVVLALLVVVARAHARDASPALAPAERDFASLAPAAQREIRALHEALPDVERLAIVDAHWPGADRLAAEGLAPFSSAGWTWQTRDVDGEHAWLGVAPARAGVAALLLVVTPSAPAPADTTHHTLSDGTSIHVSTWALLRDATLPIAAQMPTTTIPDAPAAAGFFRVSFDVR